MWAKRQLACHSKERVKYTVKVFNLSGNWNHSQKLHTNQEMTLTGQECCLHALSWKCESREVSHFVTQSQVCRHHFRWLHFHRECHLNPKSSLTGHFYAKGDQQQESDWLSWKWVTDSSFSLEDSHLNLWRISLAWLCKWHLPWFVSWHPFSIL